MMDWMAKSRESMQMMVGWGGGSEEGPEVEKDGWGKLGLETLFSFSHGLGEYDCARLQLWGWTEPPSTSDSCSFEHLICARRFVYNIPPLNLHGDPLRKTTGEKH